MKIITPSVEEKRCPGGGGWLNESGSFISQRKGETIQKLPCHTLPHASRSTESIFTLVVLSEKPFSLYDNSPQSRPWAECLIAFLKWHFEQAFRPINLNLLKSRTVSLTPLRNWPIISPKPH